MLTLVVILAALSGAAFFVQLVVPAAQSRRRGTLRTTLARWISRGPSGGRRPDRTA